MLAKFKSRSVRELFWIDKRTCVRIINPTPQQFISVYKTLIVNNFVSSHSPGANCQKDVNELLSNLRDFLEKKEPKEENMEFSIDIDAVPMEKDINQIVENKENMQPKTTDKKVYLYNYIAGSLAKNILKSVNFCQNCKYNLTSNTNEIMPEHK